MGRLAPPTRVKVKAGELVAVAQAEGEVSARSAAAAWEARAAAAAAAAEAAEAAEAEAEEAASVATPVRRNPTLKDAVRTVQAAQYLERRHKLIREGKHACPPADMPPTLANGSAAAGSAVAGSAAAGSAAAADPHAHACAHAHVRPSLKAAVRSVQTAQHLERKLYLIREGKHAPPATCGDATYRDAT